MKYFSVAMLMVVAMAISSCGSPSKGRIKGTNERDLVGSDRAGIGVYDRLVQGGLAKLVGGKYQEDVIYDDGSMGLKDMHSNGSNRLNDEFRNKAADGGVILIAFIGIENQSEEELGSNEDAVYRQINDFFVNSTYKFEVISRRSIEAVMRATGVRTADDLFVASKRDAFVTELRSSGGEPDYFVWGTVNSQSTSYGDDLSERSYQISMEIVRAVDGRTVGSSNHEGATKEYNR
ncbi:MAG: hypothetical protein L3J82_03275 [Planctomycetes bacterium]|nr:hypothetical protein [Planctomycetota bacterium]